MEKAETFEVVLFLDADACPKPILEILFRVVQRKKIRMVLVANRVIRVPNSELIRSVAVGHGLDSADKKIIELMRAGDVVITNDIPLAAAAVEAGGIAIGMRGELFDEATVHSRLASRNLMEQLREAGMEQTGPKPHSAKDTQAFANQLDRLLAKICR